MMTAAPLQAKETLTAEQIRTFWLQKAVFGVLKLHRFGENHAMFRPSIVYVCTRKFPIFASSGEIFSAEVIPDAV